MGLRNRSGNPFKPSGPTPGAGYPMAEPLEPRRLLSASILSAPPVDVPSPDSSVETRVGPSAGGATPADATATGAVTATNITKINGDINGDGRVDSDDVALYDRGLARYLAGAIAPGTAALTDGDANGDGVVDHSDLLVIYAAMYGPVRPTVISGDVNGDGRVDADDVALYDRGQARYLAGAIAPGAAALTDGDANRDGVVDNGDLLVITTALFRPVLLPGPGFTGPTPQPPPAGTPDQPGYGETAIARWDVVPYQTFDATMNVGIVAFHMNGIDRVEFSVDGGPPAAVRAMTTNPQTGVVEYWVTLNAGTFVADGVVEVRAVAYPTVGTPRVLDSLDLNVNGQHTLPALVRYVSPTGSNTTGDGSLQHPFQTIKQAAMSIKLQSPAQDDDNGTIYLLPGDYAFSGGWTGPASALPITESAWLTISAAPGVTADQARITVGGSGDRLNASRVRLANLTVYDTGLVSNTNLNQPAAIWFDNCVLAGSDLTRDITFAGPTQWTGGIYATGTWVHDAVNGLSAATFLRDDRVSHIESDAFQNAQVLINCSTYDILSANAGTHPDVVQFFSPAGTTIENRVIYGLIATVNVNAQGLFAGPGFSLQDVALVDCRVDTGRNVYYAFQFCGPARHLYVARSAFGGIIGGAWRTDLGFAATDVVVAGTTFSNNLAPAPGVTYR